MPLTEKDWAFAKNLVQTERDEYGVYELLSSGDILYVGEGVVRSRLMAHFPDGPEPIVGAERYRVEYTGSKEKAEQREREELERYRIQKGRLPEFNQKVT